MRWGCCRPPKGTTVTGVAACQTGAWAAQDCCSTGVQERQVMLLWLWLVAGRGYQTHGPARVAGLATPGEDCFSQSWLTNLHPFSLQDESQAAHLQINLHLCQPLLLPSRQLGKHFQCGSTQCTPSSSLCSMLTPASYHPLCGWLSALPLERKINAALSNNWKSTLKISWINRIHATFELLLVAYIMALYLCLWFWGTSIGSTVTTIFSGKEEGYHLWKRRGNTGFHIISKIKNTTFPPLPEIYKLLTQKSGCN